MFAGHVPAADAEALRRARAAGAVLVGKTQTHEFAWGISSVNELMGTSRNPWAPDRISGGSSGGSAVALATHQVTLALGSDTGGSIRVPSALCGTVGFKPTYGRVSTAGIWPLARTLDHPGPDGADARRRRAPARGHRRLGRRRPGDARRARSAISERRSRHGLEGVVVGVCPDLHLVPLTPAVQARVRCGARGRGRLRRADRGGRAARGARHLPRVRRHAARRGAAQPRRGGPLPGARGRVRRGRAGAPRGRLARGHPRLPAGRRRAHAHPRRRSRARSARSTCCSRRSAPAPPSRSAPRCSSTSAARSSSASSS